MFLHCPPGKPDSLQWQAATDLNDEQKPGLLVGKACGQFEYKGTAKDEKLNKDNNKAKIHFIIFIILELMVK